MLDFSLESFQANSHFHCPVVKGRGEFCRILLDSAISFPKVYILVRLCGLKFCEIIHIVERDRLYLRNRVSPTWKSYAPYPHDHSFAADLGVRS